MGEKQRKLQKLYSNNTLPAIINPGAQILQLANTELTEPYKPVTNVLIIGSQKYTQQIQKNDRIVLSKFKTIRDAIF